jgi:putative N6-adenine-specific DNA methylase
VRVESFRARALGELERKAVPVPWREWLPPGVTVHLRVTSRKSRLYHQKAIAERVGHAIQAAGWEVRAGGADGDSDEGSELLDDRPAQAVMVRLFRDQCSISLDSSGALLHRRGYRLATAKAPLRETLAAALLHASGWEPTMPLIDPFAGSGTIPIEAALMARRIPPGRHRRFAFQRWPRWNAGDWDSLLAQADAQSLPRAPAPIVASDRDAGAIRAALTNAERAGVGNDVMVQQRPLSALEPPPGRGALVTNPPYGVRVSERSELRDLFARLGQVARERLPGWSVTLLLPGWPLEKDTGLRFREIFSTSNGGIRVRALTLDEGQSG